jgi:L-fucose mutarotase
MLDTPYTRMVDLGFSEAEESEICREFVRIVERYEGPRWQIGRIDRFGFYDRARTAFAVVVTGETRVNGSLLLTKGIVRLPDPIQPVPLQAAPIQVTSIQAAPIQENPGSSR